MHPDDTTQPTLEPTNRPTVVWCLGDGRTGHARQIEGLVRQIDQDRNADVRWISIEDVPHGRLFSWWLRGRFPPGNGLSLPHLIVGAGHRTHLAVLAARRAFGGRAVVLMRPTLPTRLFDLCLVPEHDLEKLVMRFARRGVIPTRGVLNPFPRSDAADPRQALLLVGGPSRHHGWSDNGVLRQIRQLLALSDPQTRWTISTSRRTPESLLPQLSTAIPAERPQETIRIVPFEQTAGGWLASRLAESGTVFVTEDSISMVYEALTVGADVGLIHVPRRRPNSRNARCIDRMVAERLVVRLCQWRRTRFDERKRETFHEATRCAKIVCDRLLDAA